MVKINPVPVFGAPPPPKKKNSIIWWKFFTEISVQTVGAQGKSSILTGIVWDTNMAAVLLF